MYLSQGDVQRIFAVIAGRFPTATVLAETMNPMVVRRFKEKSIEGSQARFTWGVRGGRALAALLPGFRFAGEHGLTEGMAAFVPIYRLLDKLPAVRNISNRIVVLERGRIAACGSHEELLRTCETYREIYDSQMGEEEPHE